MRTLLVIGIGAGDPDQMTVQAIKALNRAEVVFIPAKQGKDGLAELRREICRRFMTRESWREVGYAVPKRAEPDPSYRQSVDDWHAAIGATWEKLLEDELDENGCAALLVWGDPSLYDSTLRIVEHLVRRGRIPFEYEVFPGITSIQALAAKHRIPLNTIGGPVHITTGRRLSEKFPVDADSVVVMLDGVQAFRSVPPENVDIYWGANLGTASESAIAGPLGEKADAISQARATARDKAGWVMDTYLLRKRLPDSD